MAEVVSIEAISENSPQNLDELLSRIRLYFGNGDLSLIEKAYSFAEKAHSGQIRRSGEAYFFHPLGVAGILADLQLDLATIATGLLHDTVEDTKVTLEDIEREFGKTVRELVDGVTKIGQIHFRNTHEKQSENFRKMVLAMNKDVRVILVKLADRFHNMRTLNHMPLEKQKRIALETLDIYAPLASRLGISSVKIELEDLSFRYSTPDMYYQLAQKVAKKKRERELYIDEVKKLVSVELSEKARFDFEVQGRPKHLFSIYKKMQARSIDYEQVYDVLAFRVLVASIPECYEVLGHIHSIFKPIPGRFKDYIAMPKLNKYQSLHTTVIGPGGERIEIQIRTREMHLIAERGIAAHWKYKEGGRVQDETFKKMEWLNDLVTQHQGTGSSGEFLENVKTDLFESEIYVFTPTGDVREFPEGATPIDFAYAIHTGLGNKCTGARLNGKLVPLKTKMRSGDSVEIITSENQTPSKDWLKMCVTSRAKSKIRAFVKNEERKRAHEMGQQIMEKELRRFGYSMNRVIKDSNFPKALKDVGVSELEDLYVRIGYGKLVVKDLLKHLDPQFKDPETAEKPQNFLEKVYQSALKKRRKSQSIIKVDGMDDLLVRFARCCNPIPGDPIVGFISRGRGITVHKADCEKVFALDDGRAINVAWTVKSAPEGVERTARVRVVSNDTPGLLKAMSESFATLGINILNAQVRTTKDKKAICIFDIGVKDTSQLSQAMQNLQKVKGVLGVTRVTQV
jgi:guanosine-3',5'-bis(diphosphate) 3'-pyrophosphohydrolase